jgi:putative endopeptidase
MDEKKVEAEDPPLAAEIARIDAIRTPPVWRLKSRLHWIASPRVSPLRTQDFKNSSVNQAWLYQGGLGLPDREYYVSDDSKQKEIRAGYVPHMKVILGLGGESSEAAAGGSAKILAFETRLAKASMTPVEQRDPNAIYHPMDLAELERISPAFPWKTYFSGIGLPSPGVVNVGQPEFFKEVSRMTSEVPLDDWKTYLRWQLLHSESERLRRRSSTGTSDSSARSSRARLRLRPRWKRMVQSADQEPARPWPALRREILPARGETARKVMVDNPSPRFATVSRRSNGWGPRRERRLSPSSTPSR